MGNASSNPVRNMDKRTARREYKEDFCRAIEKYRKKIGYVKPPKKKNNNEIDLKFKEERIYDENNVQDLINNINNVKVFVRKRPIFPHEINDGEFDAISCLKDSSILSSSPSSPSSSLYNKIIVHDARMHVDMVNQYLHHHSFNFDGVFHENSSNEEVYGASIKPLVAIACGGGYSTALVYGQTGSGKTFTMSSIYKLASEEIFSFYDSIVSNCTKNHKKLPKITLNYIEIIGDTINDLLNCSTNINLSTCSSGAVIPYPVIEPEVQSAEELLGVITHAINVRATAATGVHDGSSRSHSILTISIQRYDLLEEDDNDENLVEGTLMLVDLAGSEHRIDSMYHGKERRKETSYINSSLSALKECLRMRSIAVNQINTLGNQDNDNLNSMQQLLKLQQKNQHIYRKSKLTLALKASLFFPTSKTVIIACVSPSSKDTEHSLNTLRHANLMKDNINDENPNNKNLLQNEEVTSSHLTGGDVEIENIGKIDINLISKKNLLHKKQYGEFEELKTQNGNNLSSQKAIKSNNEEELTEKEKKRIKKQNEIRSFNTLDTNIKNIILNERKNMKMSNKLQSIRLRRPQAPGTLITLNTDEDGAPQEEIKIDEILDKRDQEDYDFYLKYKENKIKNKNSNQNFESTHGYSLEKEIKKYQNLNQNEYNNRKNNEKLNNENDDENYDEDFLNEEEIIEENHNNAKSSQSFSLLSSSKSTQDILTINSTSIHIDQLISSLFIIRDSVAIELILKQIRKMLEMLNYPSKTVDEKIRYYFNKYFANDDNDSISSNKMIKLTPSSTSSSSSSLSSTSNSTLPVARSRKQVISIATTLPKQQEAPRTFSSYGGINAIGVSQIPSQEAPLTKSKIILKNNIKNKSINSNEEVNPSLLRSSSAPRVIHTPPSNISRTPRESSGGANTRGTPPSQETMRAAREKLEQEANIRKERQLQAKKIRAEQEEQKRLSLLNQRPSSSSSSDQGNLDINEEIIRLTNLLEQDKYAKGDEKLSLAQKFALKKQLALHKATILKAQRPSKTSSNSSNDDQRLSSSTSTHEFDPNDIDNPFIPRANIVKDVKKRYHNDVNYDNNVPPAASTFSATAVKDNESVLRKNQGTEEEESYYVSKGGRLLNSKNVNDLKSKGIYDGYEEIREEIKQDYIEEDVYDPKEHFKSVTRSTYCDPRTSKRNYF